KLAALIADGGNFKTMLSLESAHQIDHLRKRLGLGVHERLERFLCERTFPIKNNSIQVFIQAELALFVGIEGQVMSFMHLLIVQAELVGRAFLDIVIPAIREQDTTDVQE